MKTTTMHDPETGETYSQAFVNAGTATTLLARVSDPTRFRVGDKVTIGALRGAVTGVDHLGGQILVTLIKPAAVATATPWVKDDPTSVG